MDNELYIYSIFKPQDRLTYVGIRFKIMNGKSLLDENFQMIGPLDLIRQYFVNMGLTVVPRSPHDDTDLIESWL
jgi:hypothetical protein